MAFCIRLRQSKIGFYNILKPSSEIVLMIHLIGEKFAYYEAHTDRVLTFQSLSLQNIRI